MFRLSAAQRHAYPNIDAHRDNFNAFAQVAEPAKLDRNQLLYRAIFQQADGTLLLITDVVLGAGSLEAYVSPAHRGAVDWSVAQVPADVESVHTKFFGDVERAEQSRRANLPTQKDVLSFFDGLLVKLEAVLRSATMLNEKMVEFFRQHGNTRYKDERDTMFESIVWRMWSRQLRVCFGWPASVDQPVHDVVANSIPWAAQDDDGTNFFRQVLSLYGLGIFDQSVVRTDDFVDGNASPSYSPVSPNASPRFN